MKKDESLEAVHTHTHTHHMFTEQKWKFQCKGGIRLPDRAIV